MADSYQDLKSLGPTIVLEMGPVGRLRVLVLAVLGPEPTAGDPVAELSIHMQVCNFTLGIC